MSKTRSKEVLSGRFFEDGITTRVMAKKLILQSQRDNEDKHSLRGRDNSRRGSKFLSGASIPNSTIRASLDSSKKVEFTDKIESIHSTKISASVSVNNDTDQKRLSEERGLERIRQKIHSSAAKQEIPLKTEKKRSSQRTLDVEVPPTRRRRSTLESIKDAIDNSQEQGNKLVNADSMEKRNMGQYYKLPSDPPNSVNSDSHQSQLVAKDATTNSPQRKSIQKQDLQTQTSLLLEKILPQTGSD